MIKLKPIIYLDSSSTILPVVVLVVAETRLRIDSAQISLTLKTLVEQVVVAHFRGMSLLQA